MSKRPAPPIRLRKANQEDVNFIFNAWLKSYKFSYFARNITNTIFFAEHHKIIERLLKSYDTIVACNDSDPTQIYGFINAGSTEGIFTLNYVYVKQAFRGLGIAKVLFNAFDPDITTASIYTHHARIADRLSAKYNLVYHPYVMINYKEDTDEA